jgi:hypothetical protein
MPEVRRLYGWRELGEVPDQTGVYAWYYQHTLTEKDINDVLARLATELDPAARIEQIRHFLDTYLFRVFVESPYAVTLRGKLKPQYSGEVKHNASISKSLLERLAADPQRLWTVKKALDTAVPEFAAPVYIGMAKKLRTRLMKHKDLIREYGNNKPRGPVEFQDEEDQRDHSFAQDVVSRNFAIHKLAVSVRLVVATDSSHVDVENILNRINFPLCGRN